MLFSSQKFKSAWPHDMITSAKVDGWPFARQKDDNRLSFKFHSGCLCAFTPRCQWCALSLVEILFFLKGFPNRLHH